MSLKTSLQNNELMRSSVTDIHTCHHLQWHYTERTYTLFPFAMQKVSNLHLRFQNKNEHNNLFRAIRQSLLK